MIELGLKATQSMRARGDDSLADIIEAILLEESHKFKIVCIRFRCLQPQSNREQVVGLQLQQIRGDPDVDDGHQGIREAEFRVAQLLDDYRLEMDP